MLKRRIDTPECRECGEFVDRTAREVASWPKGKRGGRGAPDPMLDNAEGDETMPNTAEAELLPCPLCGETRIEYETTVTERAVRCTRCGLRLVRDASTVLPEHVWNTRMGDENDQN